MKATPAAPIASQGTRRSSSRALLALLRATGTAAPAGRVPALLCGVALALAAALLFTATSASAAAPTVTTEPASEVGVSGAHLSGQVNPQGEAGSTPTFWHFQLSETGEPGTFAIYAGGGEISGPEAEAANPVAVSVNAENLQPGVEYFVQLVAQNEQNPETGEFANTVETEAPFPAFTTEAATAPVLASAPASEVSYVTAHLSGSVDPQGGNLNPTSGPLAIYWYLQYREAPEGGWATGREGVIEGAEAQSSGPIPVEVTLPFGTLQPAKVYEARVFAYYLNFSREASSPEPFPTFETLFVAAPSVSIDPVTTFTATTAHLTGSVNPEGSDPAFNSSCRFDYVTQSAWIEAGETFAAAAQVPCEPETVEGAGSQEVKADLTGLIPHTTYHLRLVASNAGGTSEAIAAETLTTAVQAPLISNTAAANVSADSADLRAQLNPGGGATTYHFEYGTSEAYGQSTAESGSIGSDNAEHQTGVHISGLEPETTYHFRIVATNSASPSGGTPGPDLTFTTQPGVSSTALPDGRQWELVSPPDKHGAEVSVSLFFYGGLMQAADNGDAISYITTAPTSGTSASNPLENQVLSRRGPGGWSSQDIATPHAGAGEREWHETPESEFVRLQAFDEYWAFSSDLSLAYVEPEATTPLASPAPAPKRTGSGYDSGYVRDNNTGTYALTKQSVTEWYEEQAALSASQPRCDAATSPAGGTVGQEGVQAISQDGCYVYFNSAGGAGPLEVAHYDGTQWNTTLISSLAGAGALPWGSAGFTELSPNGRYLTFMSDESLTGYNNTDANSPLGEPRADEEVFLYDAATDSLTCPSCDPTGARPVGQFDITRVHDFAPNVNSPGVLQVDPAPRGWKNRWLAGLLPRWPYSVQPGNLGIERPYSHQPRYLTDSGELFFESPVSLVPQDVNGTWDVYEYRPQGVSGCAKPNGCDALISSGQSSKESVLIEASTDGSDVFFFTSERLTGQDADNVNDVYDAHVCSAAVPCPPPPPPPAPACEGDACQQPAAPPNHPTPGTTLLNGPGNVLECPKGKVKKGAKCVTKKSNKKNKHEKSKGKNSKKGRNTSHNRGGQK